MIVQNVSAEGHTDLSFTLPKEDLAKAEPILRDIAREVDSAGVTSDEDIAKVSLIGAGMKSDPGVAAACSRRSPRPGSTSRSSRPRRSAISCVVRAADVERAVQVVHDRFGLAETPSS